MNHNLIPIYNAANAIEAQLLKEQLAERGIECWITNEALQGASGELPMGWASSPRVVVASEDAEKARDVALAFDANIVARAHATRSEKPHYDAGADTLDDPGYLWPRCPKCEQRRLAVCPFCKTAGANFSLAYTGPTDAEAGAPVKLLVECPMCDEAFTPKFYKLCETCGHEFPDGTAVPQPRAEVHGDAFNENRILIVVGVSLAFCAVLGAYFWWLWRE